MIYKQTTLALLAAMIFGAGSSCYAGDYLFYKCPLTEELYKKQLSENSYKEHDFYKNSVKKLESELNGSKSNKVQSEVSYCLGTLHSAVDNLKETIKYLNISIQVNGQNPLPYMALGDTYFEMSNLKAASLNYEKAATLDKALITVILNASRMYYLQGDYTKAISLLRNSESYKKGRTNYLNGLILEGDINVKLKKYKEAAKVYVKSLALLNSLTPWSKGSKPRMHPKELVIYKKIIDVYCLDGQSEMVEKYYQLAVERNILAEKSKEICISKG